MQLSEFPQEFPACACQECQALCQRPCWPTPAEARQLLTAGYGQYLMLAWWEGAEGKTIFVLCPAVSGHEGFYAPDPDDWDLYAEARRCLMQTPNGLCQLHRPGLKPLEGRLAAGCASYSGTRVRRTIATLWATPEGQHVVAAWRKAYAKV
jgi:hypothetical protein